MATVEDGTGTPLTVIVFARRPRCGRVKRRLARTLGTAAACGVYTALLERTLVEVEGLRATQRIVMPAAPGDARWFRQTYKPRGWRVRAQRQGGLGQRMDAALELALRGYRAVLLLGSDVADFRTADLVAAATALRDGADVVFGPAADGGYWLVGLRMAQPRLFRDIAWSSANVLAETLSVAARNKLKVATVAMRHDVDYARDLKWLTRAVGQRMRARSRSSRAT